jgi:hypothetical protein
MTGSTATDSSGVEYFFEFMGSETGGSGGSDSGWQASNAYMDDGLDANEYYSYRVIARDMSPVHNETAPSSIEAAATWIEQPTGIDFSGLTTTSMMAKSANTPSNLTGGSSGLIVECTTLGTDTGWKQDNDWWEVSPLTPNTSYGFQAKARNREGVETGYCTTTYRYTLAALPGADCFTDVDVDEITVNWDPSGNPAGTEYYCQNITTSQTSGWITDTHWVSGGLSSDTVYQFKVAARNGDGVKTSFTYLGNQMTMGPDTDGDGMSDAWEMSHFGDLSQGADDDSDGDGSTNYEEFAAGTNPVVARSFFAIVNITRQDNGDIVLEYMAAKGKQYAVEFSDHDIGPGMTWTTAQDHIVSVTEGALQWEDDGSLTVIPPQDVPLQRYYRVKVYGPYGCY